MAYLRLVKDNNFDADWIKEMDLVSNGLADLEYCKKMGVNLPTMAQNLVGHGVKLNHCDEKNVLLEFRTDQHFVFPEGGGHAIIKPLFSEVAKYGNCTVMWETGGQAPYGRPRPDASSQVRKSNGLLYDVLGGNVMLACGGFEGNPEMATCISSCIVDLPLIAPRLVHSKRAGVKMVLEVGAGTAGSFDTPYSGYPMTANLTFAYGRVKTNTDAQVLGTNDVPMPGLHAAGELIGLSITNILQLHLSSDP